MQRTARRLDPPAVFLAGLAACAVRSADFLAACGFTSCLVDALWMQRNASPEEWRDYLEVSRALAAETIHSSDPADILLSDPGQYVWHTRLIERRIAERFSRFGAAAELFDDPGRRHLIYPSVPQQRLSIALERATDQAVAAFEDRLHIFHNERRRELARHEPAILHALATAGRDSVQAVEHEFLAQLRNRFDEEPLLASCMGARDAARVSVACAGVTCHLEPSVVFHREDRGIDGGGTFHVSMHVDRRLVHFSRSLPHRFDSYRSFQNAGEWMLCCFAWVAMLTEAARAGAAALQDARS